MGIGMIYLIAEYWLVCGVGLLCWGSKIQSYLTLKNVVVCLMLGGLITPVAAICVMLIWIPEYLDGITIWKAKPEKRDD